MVYFEKPTAEAKAAAQAQIREVLHTLDLGISIEPKFVKRDDYNTLIETVHNVIKKHRGFADGFRVISSSFREFIGDAGASVYTLSELKNTNNANVILSIMLHIEDIEQTREHDGFIKKLYDAAKVLIPNFEIPAKTMFNGIRVKLGLEQVEECKQEPKLSSSNTPSSKSNPNPVLVHSLSRPGARGNAR